MKTKHWNVKSIDVMKDRTQVCLDTNKGPKQADFNRLLKKACNYGTVNRFDTYDNGVDKNGQNVILAYIGFSNFCDAERFMKDILGWKPKAADKANA